MQNFRPKMQFYGTKSIFFGNRPIFCYHQDWTPKRQHFRVDPVARRASGRPPGPIFGPKICILLRSRARAGKMSCLLNLSKVNILPDSQLLDSFQTLDFETDSLLETFGEPGISSAVGKFPDKVCIYLEISQIFNRSNILSLPINWAFEGMCWSQPFFTTL